MSAEPAAPSRLAAAHFWRWLLAGFLLFATVGWLVSLGLAQLIARIGANSDLASALLIGQLAALAGSITYALYTIVFLADYFFFQRFERVAGRRLTALWALGTAALIAAVIAAWFVHQVYTLVLAGVAMVIAGAAGGGLGPGPLAVSLIQLVPGAIIGGGFGLLLWWMQQRHSALLRGRASHLLQAHLWGGVIAGVLLTLKSVAFTAAFTLFQARLPSVVSLAVLPVAVMPHLILTWRAMRPALAQGARDMTSAGAFTARLLAALVLLGVLWAL